MQVVSDQAQGVDDRTRRKRRTLKRSKTKFLRNALVEKERHFSMDLLDTTLISLKFVEIAGRAPSNTVCTGSQDWSAFHLQASTFKTPVSKWIESQRTSQPGAVMCLEVCRVARLIRA